MTIDKRESEQATADDLRPDAWQRFERAVDVALRHKPVHRAKPKAAVNRFKAMRKQPKN
jgi:hypothetical protein